MGNSPIISPMPYWGMPSRMKAMSALVPPMSRLMVLPKPESFDTKLAPMTPAAVPERIICAQALLPSSALITPPFDFVTRGSAGTPAPARAYCRDVRMTLGRRPPAQGWGPGACPAASAS